MDSKEININDYLQDEIGRCDTCQRCTWTKEEIGKKCLLPQPWGDRCVGKFVTLKEFINNKM